MAPPHNRRHSHGHHTEEHHGVHHGHESHDKEQDQHHHHHQPEKRHKTEPPPTLPLPPPPRVSEYTTQDSDGHVVHHHHQGGHGHGGRNEHIEVIIRQPPPQQIQFPTPPPPPPTLQPIIVNTTGGNTTGEKHNPMLYPSTNTGPSAKKKKGGLEMTDQDQDHVNHVMYKTTKIAEGTGLSMYPLYDIQNHPAEKKHKGVEFKDKVTLKQLKANNAEDDEENRMMMEPDVEYKEKEDSLEVKRQYGEHCPLCGVGTLKEEFTWTGWLFAILCFPCGIFLLFASKAVTCSYCRQVFHL